MNYGKIGEMSAQDARQANDAHYQIESDIQRMMSDLSLSDKMEVQKMVREYCMKQSSK